MIYIIKLKLELLNFAFYHLKLCIRCKNPPHILILHSTKKIQTSYILILWYKSPNTQRFLKNIENLLQTLKFLIKIQQNFLYLLDTNSRSKSTMKSHTHFSKSIFKRNNINRGIKPILNLVCTTSSTNPKIHTTIHMHADMTYTIPNSLFFKLYFQSPLDRYVLDEFRLYGPKKVFWKQTMYKFWKKLNKWTIYRKIQI